MNSALSASPASKVSGICGDDYTTGSGEQDPGGRHTQ